MRHFLSALRILFTLVAFQSLADADFPYAGIYFGTFADTPGEWAFLVDSADRGEFVGFAPEQGGPIISYPYTLEWSDNGVFDDQFLNDSGDSHHIQGRITDGQVSGSYQQYPPSGGSLFSGEIEAGELRVNPPVSGYFQLEGVSEFRVLASAIVGTSGKVLAVVQAYATESTAFTWTRSWGGGASGVIDDEGRVYFDGSQGLTGVLTISATGDAHGLLAVPGFHDAPIEFFKFGNPDHPFNLSTRGWVGEGHDTMISGFVVEGNGPNRILLRAVGETLGDYGVLDFLWNPTLSVYDQTQSRIPLAVNDDIEDNVNAREIVEVSRRVGAFPIGPGGWSHDAALLLTLEPGVYTAQISAGPGAENGIALFEMYAVNDLAGPSVRPVNISTRGIVQTDGVKMFLGFVADSSAHTFLVRAVGPTLGQPAFGVGAVLSDPVLTFVRTAGGESTTLTNDDWDVDGSGNDLAAYALQVGAFPLLRGSRDAAMIVHVPAFSGITTNTVRISGKDGATGVVLAEVYEIDPAP